MHGRLTGLDNISRGEGRVTEDTIRVSSEIKDSWGRRYRLSGVKSNSVQGFKFKMLMGFLLVDKTQSIQLFPERLSEKMCTRQSRKVIRDMMDTLFLTTVAVEPTFVPFR